jgi:hypothetical protein
LQTQLDPDQHFYQIPVISFANPSFQRNLHPALRGIPFLSAKTDKWAPSLGPSALMGPDQALFQTQSLGCHFVSFSAW